MIPSQADPSEVLNRSEEINQKSSITPSAKNLTSDLKASPKPIVPIIKIPSRSSGLAQPMISSDRNMRGETIQEQAPAAEMEGGAKSKRSLKSKASSKPGAASREEIDDDEEEEEEESGGSGPDPAAQPEGRAKAATRPVQESEEEESEGDDDGGDEESDEKPPVPPKKKESKTRADEEEDSDDKDSDDSDSSLGIDLSNYYTKEEADKMLKDQIKQMQNTLQNDYSKLIKE